MTQRRPNPAQRPCAFSLIELVIVVVIIGVVAAIAVPRMSRAADTSKQSALAANVASIQGAIDRYTTEIGRPPVRDASGNLVPDWRHFAVRLIRPVNTQGTPDLSGTLGPYLTSWPANPINSSRAIHWVGGTGRANASGYIYDIDTNTISAGTELNQITDTVDLPPPNVVVISAGLPD